MKKIFAAILIFLSIYAGAQELIHIVAPGDTLCGISRKFQISVDEIKKRNSLETNDIYTGQKLILSKTEKSEPEHLINYYVRRGDTLYSVALAHDMAVGDLLKLNELESSSLKVGQKLKVKTFVKTQDKATPYLHIVLKGETLEDIAAQYDVIPKEIMNINHLQSSRVQEGMRLYLKPVSIAAIGTHPRFHSQPAPEAEPQVSDSSITASWEKNTSEGKEHIVQKGDTLYSLSRKYGVSVADLRLWNRLQKDQIFPGQKLRIISLNQTPSNPADLEEIQKVPAVYAPPADFIDHNGDAYFNYTPIALKQPSADYFEDPKEGPWETYLMAREIQDQWSARVEKLPALSAALRGYHFVLDPGHGGLDPGTIVESVDGRGNSLYVVEDEYVYDTTLRIAKLLKQHGAEVTLTILSPNHMIRDTEPAGFTLVNQKNEVYNLSQFNEENRPLDWPRGGRAGLNRRVAVARTAFEDVPKAKRIFLSFHADNSPEAPKGTGILYLENEAEVDLLSAGFAEDMLEFMGYGGYSKGQDLAVLRENPSAIKLLIELRNVSFTDHSWAIRFSDLRQRDAEKVVKALLVGLK